MNKSLLSKLSPFEDISTRLTKEEQGELKRQQLASQSYCQMVQSCLSYGHKVWPNPIKHKYDFYYDRSTGIIFSTKGSLLVIPISIWQYIKAKNIIESCWIRKDRDSYEHICDRKTIMEMNYVRSD